MDLEKFYGGREFEAYEYLGAHVGKEGTIFRTYAPQAVKVSVVGEFNDFKETFMEPVEDGKFYECFIPQAEAGMRYRYRIYTNEEEYCDHCDPYGFAMEVRPGYHSVIFDLQEYRFQDEAWIAGREEKKEKPLSVYEVHLGSFLKGQGGNWLTYEEFSEKLVSYVKNMGYNYIQFLPLAENPC